MLKSIFNVHGASDNYLSCSKRAGLTWLESYIYKYVNMPYCCTETYFEYGFIATYIHSSLYSCVTNMTILTIHITWFLIRVFQRTSQTDIINTHSNIRRNRLRKSSSCKLKI